MRIFYIYSKILKVLLENNIYLIFLNENCWKWLFDNFHSICENSFTLKYNSHEK